MEKELHSPKSLAQALKVKQQTIYNWIQQGCPTEIRQSKFVRLDYDKVIAWIKDREESND